MHQKRFACCRQAGLDFQAHLLLYVCAAYLTKDSVPDHSEHGLLTGTLFLATVLLAATLSNRHEYKGKVALQQAVQRKVINRLDNMHCATTLMTGLAVVVSVPVEATPHTQDFIRDTLCTQ